MQPQSVGELKKALEKLQESIFEGVSPIRVHPVRVYTQEIIPKGGVVEFTIESWEKYSAVVVTVKASYDPNATSGVRVRWLYSADGQNFDSPEDAEGVGNYDDLSFQAGSVRQRTILIPLFLPYVRIQIVNLDLNYGVTVDAWYAFMR